ncbi:hypothetical protein [Halococcus agarilyticus]|uniref:hypothetical protein n=1 Tax=Halococcus agarilyticus TaxID=1232219 RepID=UPI000677BEF0|nr:hypothetical protein [Halococcus agarilyticus]
MRRRTILKSSGTVLATALASVSVSGSPGTSGDGPSAQRAGISNTVEQLLHNDKPEQAERLLERHDIEYGGRSTTGPSLSRTSLDGVTTQDAFVESESTFNIYSWYDYNNGEGNDVFRTSYHWTVSPDADKICFGNHPADGVSVTYSDDRWAYDGNVDTGPYVDTVDDERYGVTAEYESDAHRKDDNDYNGDVSSHLAFDMEKQESGQHRIYADYAHTWKTEGLLGGNCLSGLNVAFSAAGKVAGISISWGGTEGTEWVHSLNSIEV